MSIYTYIVSEGQSLRDVCLQELGGLDNFVRFCYDNNLSPTAILSAGHKLLINDELIQSSEVVKYFVNRNRINTEQNQLFIDIDKIEFYAVIQMSYGN